MITFSQDMQNRFGKKVYKLSLDAQMSCPNRDGTLSSKGCIFCSAGGSGDFAVQVEADEESIEAGIWKAKEKVEKKIKNRECLFIAYFQAFSNTYAPIEKLRKLFFLTIKQPDICGISIATRPDCLSKDIIDLLTELNQIKPIWVELGLQTIHPKTAKWINRCYPLEVYDKAMQDLQKAGIETVVHLILGFPMETKVMMLESVQYVCESKASGIKLQLLHVLKNTALGDMYQKEPFEMMSLEEYANLIEECIKILPKDMVVHRLTGDGAKKDLLAPLWSADKKRVLNRLKKVMMKPKSLSKPL